MITWSPEQIAIACEYKQVAFNCMRIHKESIKVYRTTLEYIIAKGKSRRLRNAAYMAKEETARKRLIVADAMRPMDMPLKTRPTLLQVSMVMAKCLASGDPVDINYINWSREYALEAMDEKESCSAILSEMTPENLDMTYKHLMLVALRADVYTYSDQLEVEYEVRLFMFETMTK